MNCTHPPVMDDMCGACWLAMERLPTTVKEALWLLDGGESFPQAACQLGVRHDSLARAFHRAGIHRPGLWVGEWAGRRRRTRC